MYDPCLPWRLRPLDVRGEDDEDEDRDGGATRRGFEG